MNIELIKLQDIPLEMITEGKKQSLIFREDANALYLGGFVDGVLACITCLVIYKNKSATIKSNFTRKEYRGKGYFTELNKFCLNYAKEHGVKVINLNCLKDSVNIHIKHGAVQWKATKNIYWLTYRF